VVVELCQNHVRTLWVTLLGDGNQSPQVRDKIFNMPEATKQGKGEEVRGGHGRGGLVLGCAAPRSLGRAPGWGWGSGLSPAAWLLGKGEQPITLAVPLQLFDFIAQCVRQFLAGIGSSQDRLPLGFVFPFSCRQTRLDKVSGTTLPRGHSRLLPSASSAGSGAGPVTMASGSATCSPQAELISWSKGFGCSDVVGKDIVQLLQSAINKQEVGGRGAGGLAGGFPRGGANDALALPSASSTTWTSLP